MHIEKPINWKDIPFRHRTDTGIKGKFGEEIVKESLNKLGLRLERNEKRAPGLPDYRISGTHFFVEVKSHDTGPRAKPPVWQKPLFSMMAKMGWKILIAHPRISINKKSEKIICESISWYEFNNNGALIRIPKFPLKKILKNS